LTATALVAAARLGSRCAYAGVLGSDSLSEYAIEQLAREGVDLRHLRRRSAAGPVHSFIVVDETKGTRNIFFDVAGAVGADADWPEAAVIRSTRVLFVDSFGLQGMLRAARTAREAGIPVVGDFERAAGAEFEGLLGAVDHLIVSQSFAQELTGTSKTTEAVRGLWCKGREVAVVTCGAEGCWYLDRAGEARHQPAFEVKAVDTTGCGDVFHGAYAAMLARGLSLPERVRFASAAAALKTTWRGGQAGIPTREVVQKFLETQ
jgi:ribokinase